MSLRSSIVKEGAMVLAGEESPTRFIMTVALIAVGDTLLTKEVSTMEDIFIPEGYLIPVVIILAVFALLGPIFAAWFKKNQSKHQFDEWLKLYGVTMVIDMFLTPFGALLAMSIIAQQWIPGMTATWYLVLLPFISIGVSFILLTLMNEGFKAAIEQVKKIKLGAQELSDEVKKE